MGSSISYVSGVGATVESVEITDGTIVHADLNANLTANAAAVNTGTATTSFVTPDALAGSNVATRFIKFDLNATTALTTSDKGIFRVPSAMNGMDLVSVSASVGDEAASSGSSSSGAVTFTVQNGTTNMLSTNLTVDQGEYSSATAATAAVIDTANDNVATDDDIHVEVSGAGTGVTYASVTLGFRLP